LESQVKDEEKKHRVEMKNWDKKIKDSEGKLDDLTKELKEKE
jgi:hypothetical protein